MRVMTTTQAQNHHYWASIEAQIESHLKKSIPVRAPAVVFEPMHNLVMATPKTKAATLCIATCELVGGDSSSSDIVAAASALQLVHAGARVHEQLPLMVRPSVNPNIRPVAHHYCPNIELLTGDGILPFGFELLAQSVSPARGNSSRILRVMVEISRAMGSLIGGQWEEIEISKSDGGCDEVRIGSVCRKKEGEMHACGAACGAILGGGSEEEIEKLRKFGLCVGMIEGIVNSMGTRVVNEGLLETVKELRVMAMEELVHFKGRNVEPIASIIDHDKPT